MTCVRMQYLTGVYFQEIGGGTRRDKESGSNEGNCGNHIGEEWKSTR